MSDFKNNRESRLAELEIIFNAVLENKNAAEVIRRSEGIISKIIPSDIIFLVDDLVKREMPIDKLKTGINKFLNVLYKTINDYPNKTPKKGTYLDCCIKNNSLLNQKLNDLKPLIKKINTTNDGFIKQEIITVIISIIEYDRYYQIKENVLFPLLERKWTNFGCLGIMWSFHDDIRNNLKRIIDLLRSDEFDIKEFNRCIGDVFFNMKAIVFREEKILFPYIIETISNEELDQIFKESIEIGFPFYSPGNKILKTKRKKKISEIGIDLNSGILSVDQISLVFNHLPVDITYVDENNKVKYFSTPKKRIFPRSNAIIGRDVKNCHPPASVHIVEEIIDSFRTGREDKASFWIKFKNDFVLIQYFAVRDEEGNYKGIVEVSQEITEIKELKGENRILDWKKNLE